MKDLIAKIAVLLLEGFKFSFDLISRFGHELRNGKEIAAMDFEEPLEFSDFLFCPHGDILLGGLPDSFEF